MKSRLLPVLPATFAALACLGICACAALAPLAIETTRNLFRSVADRNYDPQYGNSMDKMFNIIVNAPDSPERTPGLMSSSKSKNAGEKTAEADASSLTSSFAAGVEVVDDEEEERVPIALDVALLREVLVEGRSVPVPVANGESLRDGRGRAEEGDNLKLRFRANTRCYVYAVWVDSTAWATPLFPRSSAFEMENPVEAGKEYTLPEGSQWFYLDDYRGVETLYFVASHEPIPDLDSALGELVGRQRPQQSEGTAAGQDLAVVTEPTEVTRGLGGVRESTVKDVLTSDGVAHDAQANTFVADFAGSELVVTRWFRHQ